MCVRISLYLAKAIFGDFVLRTSAFCSLTTYSPLSAVFSSSCPGMNDMFRLRLFITLILAVLAVPRT